MPDALDRVDDAIDHNATIADAILATGLTAFGLAAPTPADTDAAAPPWHGCATPADVDKARSTVRQFYRDWSAAGARERDAHYGPILADLERLFADTRGAARGDTKILIPGAGLGRLVFEVCRAGFAAEGNEIAFHALLAGNWILNALAPEERLELYPFALGFANQVSREAQLRMVEVPDVHPTTELARVAGEEEQWAGSMNMAAADFLLLYGDAAHAAIHDAVATSFFIDTAPNVVRYVETIRHTLKVGGWWINLGPLLWHFEEREPKDARHHIDGAQPSDGGIGGKAAVQRPDDGIGEPGSVELTCEELLLLIQTLGFRIEKHEILDSGCGYIQDAQSMLKNTYLVSHFVAQRIS